MLFGLKRKSLVPLPSANAPTRTSIVRLGRGTVATVFVMVVVEKEVGFVGVMELDVLTSLAAAVIVIGAAAFIIVTVVVCVGASVHSKLGTL